MRTLNHTFKGNYCKVKLLVDIFMFSSIVNGAVSSYYFNRSQDVKVLSEKRFDNLEEIYDFAPRYLNRSIRNTNVPATMNFDKMLNWMFDNEVEKGDRSRVRRSFGLGHRFAGHRKRLQFALLPIMYKMGVMTTLLTGLTVLALKGLTIGVILLIFAFGNHFIKSSKQWTQSTQTTQPIHLHVHSLDSPNKFLKYHGYNDEVPLGPWYRQDVEDVYTSPYVENSLESYRRRFAQNTAEAFRFKPIL